MQTALFVLVLAVVPVLAQEPTNGVENPLAQLKDEVRRILLEAEVPFTDDQEKSITLMMEDRRKASEDLFGGLMDFSDGPTRGQESDRLNSAIEWMRGEFLQHLQDYLDPEQLSVWKRHLESAAASGSNESGEGQAARRQNQTQFVRINNNTFTAEDNFYRRAGGNGDFGGFGQPNQNQNFRPPGDQNQGGAEVIQRGGVGAWHGNAQLLMKNDVLNAGRRFASNKPPYHEQQLTFDIGGPTITGRLTSNFGFNINRSENVDTIRATLPDSIFALGITRPSTFKTINTRQTLQLSDRHSLTFNLFKRVNDNKNQGVGGFVMPDRASDNSGSFWSIDVRQFSALSTQSIYETRFTYNGNHNKTIPRTEGVRINVTDAFSNGGAQNKSENRNGNYEFGNLYTRLGEKLTIKTGMEGFYRKNHQIQENNFTGTFTFSSLDSFVAGTPLTFRVNRGIPLLEFTSLETGYFFQNDLKLTPTFTLMSGIRYEFQTNVRDHNNFDGRLGIAYAIGRASVLRAGVGTFHQRINNQVLGEQERQDGVHQYEIVLDNPSYPDPFISGTLRLPPSIRVTDPKLADPYNTVAMVSYERTFRSTMFFSAMYDFSRDVHRSRLRNLNAPMDITSPVPSSCKPGQSKDTCVRPQPNRGNIVNLESTGTQVEHTFRLNFRDRFSIFNVFGGYQFQRSWTDTLQNLNNFGNFANNAVSQFGFASENLPSDNYNLAADWGQGTQPLHQLYTTVNARLPLGLFLSGTINAMSARRYTVTTGKDDNQDSSANDRPSGVVRSGSLGPNMIIFDFNLSKAFFFGGNGNGGSQNVNAFVNMTNAFNRPNYAIPSGVMTSPNFGHSTSAGNPREIEVGLRYQF